MVRKKKQTTWRVKASWVKCCPGLSVGQWLTVSKRVRQLRVRHKDLAAVKVIAMEVRR